MLAGDGLAVGETLGVTQEYFDGQRRDRTDSRMRHQPLCLGMLADHFSDLPIEVVDRFLKAWIQSQQSGSSLARMRSRWQRLEFLLASLAPQ
jgi:hypothetical protein